jgi:hypothetical protein
MKYEIALQRMKGKRITIIDPKLLEREPGHAHFPGPKREEEHIIQFKIEKPLDK